MEIKGVEVIISDCPAGAAGYLSPSSPVMASCHPADHLPPRWPLSPVNLKTFARSPPPRGGLAVDSYRGKAIHRSYVNKQVPLFSRSKTWRTGRGGRGGRVCGMTGEGVKLMGLDGLTVTFL